MYWGVFSFKGSLLTSVLSYNLVRIESGHHSVPELYWWWKPFDPPESKGSPPWGEKTRKLFPRVSWIAQISFLMPWLQNQENAQKKTILAFLVKHLFFKGFCRFLVAFSASRRFFWAKKIYSLKNKTGKPRYAGPKFQSPYPHINFQKLWSISISFNTFPVISIIAKACQRSPKIAKDHQKLLMIPKEHRRSLKITEDRQRS